MIAKMWGMDDEGCGNADDNGGNNGKVGEGLDDCGGGDVLLPFCSPAITLSPCSFPPSLRRACPCSPPSLRAAQVLDVRFCVLLKRTEDTAAADVIALVNHSPRHRCHSHRHHSIHLLTSLSSSS